MDAPQSADDIFGNWLEDRTTTPKRTKYLVHINDSTVLVTRCKNGCPPAELYALIQNNPTNVMACIGCTFCGRKVHRAKVGAAMLAWDQAQLNNH